MLTSLLSVSGMAQDKKTVRKSGEIMLLTKL